MIFDDCAVFDPVSETLVIADPHFDYPTHPSRGGGPLVSRTVLPRYRTLVSRYDPSEVVIAGDLFETTHEPPQEAAEAFTEMCDVAYERGARVVVTPGNHDRCGVDLLHVLPEPSTPECRLGDGETVVLHGNRSPSESASRFIIGHMHPVVECERGVLPSYLYAPEAFQGADVVVLPAFNYRVQGLPIPEALNGRANAPIVRDSLPFSSAECIGWDAQEGRTVRFALEDVLAGANR